MSDWPRELLEAKVRFWCCPIHVGAPHRVEWRDNVAHCLTCGLTSEYPVTRCWYTDCPERIPKRREFVPLLDGTYREQFVTDHRALLTHLTNSHPYDPNPPRRFTRVQ